MAQHLLLFHEDAPTRWLKTVARDCAADGLQRIGEVGFRLLGVRRPELAADAVHQDAPPDFDWALVPADRQISDFGMLACDMDATLIENECIDELAALLPDPEPLFALTRAAMEGRIPVEESLRRRVEALRGLPEATIGTLLAERIRLRQGAARLVSLAHAHGWQVVLVTGGFSQFARPVADRLGITQVLCNHLDIEDGCLCGSFSGDILDAPGKALAVADLAARSGLRMRQVIALGDGANDAEMMRDAGLAVGIRPKPVIAALATHSLRHASLDAVWHLAGGT